MSMLVLGTVRNRQGLSRAEWLKRQLKDRGLDARIEAFAAAGGKPRDDVADAAAFVSELEDGLLLGRIDLAVHALDELPAVTRPGLTLGAVLKRADVREALVVRDASWKCLADLPPGSIVGTSNARRSSQVVASRPDLRVSRLRGSTAMCIKKVREGHGGLSAAVLDVASLRQSNQVDAIACKLDPHQIMPAPVQGAAAIQLREDSVLAPLIESLNHRRSLLSVRAERALQARIEEVCRAPLAAYSEPDASTGRLTLHARIMAPDGSSSLEDQRPVEVDDPEAAGAALAEALLAAGAADLVYASRPAGE